MVGDKCYDWISCIYFCHQHHCLWVVWLVSTPRMLSWRVNDTLGLVADPKLSWLHPLCFLYLQPYLELITVGLSKEHFCVKILLILWSDRACTPGGFKIVFLVHKLILIATGTAWNCCLSPLLLIIWPVVFQLLSSNRPPQSKIRISGNSWMVFTFLRREQLWTQNSKSTSTLGG